MYRALLIGLSMLPIAPALGQTYPDKSITLVVPTVLRTSRNIVAGMIADELSTRLGQNVVTANRFGDSPIPGALSVRSAAPDGYTLLWVSNAFARTPSLVRNAGYDAVDDFEAVSLVSRTPLVLVTAPGFAEGTVAGLIEFAKSRPGALKFGSSGTASAGHVAAEMFMRHVGVRMQHVTFKQFVQARTGLIEGHIDIMFDSLVNHLFASKIVAGKVTAIAITSRTRAAPLPDVPTLHECGLLGFEDVLWTGIVAPAGTPSGIVLRLHAEIAKVLGNPERYKRYRDGGMELSAGASPGELSALIRTEGAEFAKLVRDAGMKSD